MPDAPAKRRRWNGFVCPECRHVFRVASEHDGEGVVCPSCRRLLRLPGEGVDSPPLVVPLSGTSPAETARRHDHDHDHDHPHGTGHSHGHGHRHRRRHRAGDFDETFSDKEEVSPMFGKVIIGSVSLVGVLVLAGLLWPRGEAEKPDGGSLPLVLEPQERPEAGSETDGTDADRRAAAEVVAPSVVERELVPVIRRFLEASDVEAMVPLLRHPERTRPRIERYYADGIDAPGFGRIVWDGIAERTGDVATVWVEDGRFNRQRMSLAEEAGGWKVDWESWVGWSELAWDEMRKTRPREARLFRVRLSLTDYFNFGFSDETQWSSYRLESPDSASVLYGYVPKGGEIDQRLLLTDDPTAERPFLLRVRYPEADASGSENQVIIGEVVAEGWLDPEGES